MYSLSSLSALALIPRAQSAHFAAARTELLALESNARSLLVDVDAAAAQLSALDEREADVSERREARAAADEQNQARVFGCRPSWPTVKSLPKLSFVFPPRAKKYFLCVEYLRHFQTCFKSKIVYNIVSTLMFFNA